MNSRNFFNRTKYLIATTLIILLFSIENILAKDPPPGSGAGDVRVNVLFLLDNSLSMRNQMVAGDGMFAPFDLVETDNGDIIISQMRRRGLTKINYGTERRDTSFGNSGWFRGTRNDANCGGDDTRLRNVLSMGIDRVDTNDTSDDLIYAADYFGRKIVILNVDGECQDVLRLGFRIRGLTVRTVDGSTYLFATGQQPLSIYSANLSGANGMPSTEAGTCSRAVAEGWRITLANGIAIDGQDGTPSFLYATYRGNIYRYPLVAQGDRYCPGDNDVVYSHDNSVTSTTRHPPARSIELDPGDDDVIYITTSTHEVAKYTMANPAVNNGLTEVWKQGSRGRGLSADDGTNVLFWSSRALFIGEGDANTGNGNALVYVGSSKPSVQTFDKDHASGQWQNELGGSMGSRMDGAKAAINAIVGEPTLTSGANFGYGHWSAGIPGIIGTRAAHRQRGNPDYYTGWDEEHPGVMGTGNSLPCWRGICIRVGVATHTTADIQREVTRTPLIFGTDARAFSTMALDYYTDSSVTPKRDITCQQNYVVVIGDGAWNGHAYAMEKIEDLRTVHEVNTLVVAYGGGINAGGLANFAAMARAGSCDTLGDDDCEPTIIADTPNSLLTQLQTKIEMIVANRLSFTAPSITATIEEGGSLYQAQFDYTRNQEWKGTINRKIIKPDGELCDLRENVDGAVECSCPPVDGKSPCDYNWSAAERTHTFREQRRIWTPLGATSGETTDDTGTDYITSNATTAWNNWTTDNAVAIGNLLGALGHEVVDFHRRTADGAGSTIQSYCYDLTADTSIQDGNTDDINGLINFVRGKDYFNYEPDAGNCVLDKWRSHILGDIYHSQIVQVGPPNANTAFLGQNQEAFFRASNNYGHYIRDHEKRATLLYAGGNDGMLHAFVGCEKDDAPCTGGGIEQWAFIPPFIAAKLPKIADNSLNKEDGGGGTNSIFAVDGSPVVHDMYISSMHDCPGEGDVCKQWRTILVIPYGRGGAGFSILDVSETEASAGKGPKHLFSVYNDTVHNQVLVADYLGDITPYPYLHRSYTLDGSLEAETANANIRNAADDTARDNLADCQKEATLTAAGQNFIDDGTNGCYEGNTWTWSLETHAKLLKNDAENEDIQVFLEGTQLDKGSFTIADDGATLTVKFTDKSIKRYRAWEKDDPDDTSAETFGTSVEVYIANTDKLAVGDVGDDDLYTSYAFLGDTWSSPRIFRMPSPTERSDPAKDKYVMVMGGGMSMKRGIGSNVFVIDLDDDKNIGKILKVIDIPDSDKNKITNSTPASPVVITPDMTPGIPWRGALVYINDYEGKVTKINLTSMKTGDDDNSIAIFDSTQIFDAQVDQSELSTNARYMYHSMDIAIGRDSNKVWLYMGTGDYEDPNMIPDETLGEPPIDNVLLGIKDPMSNWSYKNITTPKNLDDCVIAEGTEESEAKCPIPSSATGWKIHLPNSQKVTAEPTVFQGNVYFPIYQPNDDPCKAGAAFICGADDECGTNKSGQIGRASVSSGGVAGKCHFVGFGILSEIVVFAGKLFANIAGLAEGKTTLVVKVAAPGEVDSYRRSWKENF